MTIRIVMWFCVLLSLSGCLASHEDPNDVASDNLGLENDEDKDATEERAPSKEAPVANCSSPAQSPPKPAPQSDVEACEIKAKSCYVESKDPTQCDALSKYCSTLTAAPQPEPEPDPCGLKVEKCMKSADDPADCVWIKVECTQPPPPASSEVDSCWRKYKECYAYDNDPKLCESVAESCKALDEANLK